MGKGRGVVADQRFLRGDFVVEYAGDLIDLGTARHREKVYAKDSDVGCYMYYFCCNNKNYWYEKSRLRPRKKKFCFWSAGKKRDHPPC